MHTLTDVEANGRDLWAVVLSGGEGVRLRSLVSRIYGDGRPKQYAALLDSRTLLRQTLDRVALRVPPERTVVVAMEHHAHYLAGEWAVARSPHLLRQPQDRGTAAGVLLPAHWIHARNAGATVAVFPADHFVLEEERFVRHVDAVARFVAQHPEWIVLLGVEPTYPESEYGWIEPGRRLGWAGGAPLDRIRRFREKPSAETAGALLAAGWLWNTFVLVARASTLVDAGRLCVPGLHERLAGTVPFAGGEDESWAIRQAYALAPRANFSRAVLQSGVAPLAVAKVSNVTWCDLGTPARVARTLLGLGKAAPWGVALDSTA